MMRGRHLRRLMIIEGIRVRSCVGRLNSLRDTRMRGMRGMKKIRLLNNDVAFEVHDTGIGGRVAIAVLISRCERWIIMCPSTTEGMSIPKGLIGPSGWIPGIEWLVTVIVDWTIIYLNGGARHGPR